MMILIIKKKCNNHHHHNILGIISSSFFFSLIYIEQKNTIFMQHIANHHQFICDHSVVCVCVIICNAHANACVYEAHSIENFVFITMSFIKIKFNASIGPLSAPFIHNNDPSFLNFHFLFHDYIILYTIAN
jgi:uncharacterized membrane protein YkgB